MTGWKRVHAACRKSIVLVSVYLIGVSNLFLRLIVTIAGKGGSFISISSWERTHLTIPIRRYGHAGLTVYRWQGWCNLSGIRTERSDLAKSAISTRTHNDAASRGVGEVGQGKCSSLKPARYGYRWLNWYWDSIGLQIKDVSPSTYGAGGSPFLGISIGEKKRGTGS